MTRQRGAARPTVGAGVAGGSRDGPEGGAARERRGPVGVLGEIAEEECLALLGGARFGRLVVSGRPPLVFPVNYVLDGRCVVMRTAPGTKIDAVRRDAEVAFEVDDVDPDTESGWSVVVTGHVREEIHLLGDQPQPRPEPWSGGLHAYWLRLTPTAVTGRRVGPGPGPR